MGADKGARFAPYLPIRDDPILTLAGAPYAVRLHSATGRGTGRSTGRA